MKNHLPLLSLLALVLTLASCKGGPEPMVDFGGTMYTRVGMRFDPNRGKNLMYTTNYVGMPTYVPPGTPMTLDGLSKRALELSDDQGNEYVIRYVSKHSGDWGAWIEQNFSDVPVELPGSLSDDERDAIAQGVVREGMSREAVLLAWGYPPVTLTADPSSGPLHYDARRFGAARRTVTFDGSDRVQSVSGN